MELASERVWINGKTGELRIVIRLTLEEAQELHEELEVIGPVTITGDLLCQALREIAS